MFRGGSELLNRSVKQFAAVVELISREPREIWELDANDYSAEGCKALIATAGELQESLKFPQGKWPSPTLATKIMLGVFGNVPASDSRVTRGLRASGLVGRFGLRALRDIGRFYDKHHDVIDGHRERTLDFGSGKPADRLYSRAKVIDEIFYIQGGGNVTRL